MPNSSTDHEQEATKISSNHSSEERDISRKVKAYLAESVYSKQELARKLHIPRGQLERIAEKKGFELGVVNQRLTFLEKSIKDNEPLKETAARLRLRKNSLLQLAKKHDIPVPYDWCHNIGVWDRVNAFYGALAFGVDSLEELTQWVRLSPTEFWRFRERYDIGLPQDITPYPHFPKIDRQLIKGRSMSEMAENIGKSREHVRQYLHASGQYEIWKSYWDQQLSPAQKLRRGIE